MTAAKSFSVHWARPAKRALGTLPEKVAMAAAEFVYGPLRENPHRVGKPLRFELTGKHSAHMGDYRIIYRIDEKLHRVYIEVIAHRSDVYGRP